MCGDRERLDLRGWRRGEGACVWRYRYGVGGVGGEGRGRGVCVEIEIWGRRGRGRGEGGDESNNSGAENNACAEG